MDPFEKKVLQTIQHCGLLSQGDRVLVALSGGADSVALLMALRHWCKADSSQLSAAHINHQLRGEDSNQDEMFVRHLCDKFGIVVHIKRLHTRENAKKATHNLEDFARQQRYHFLFHIAQPTNSIVATGHNLNDQAETFLMKLIRGAGFTGLSGIYPERENAYHSQFVRVVRPLLETSRAEILAYLSRQGQPYRLDVTNEDVSLERNWVRHHLMPMVSEKLNPRVLHTVGRAARLFREMEEHLVEEGRKALAKCIKKEGREIRVKIPQLRCLPAILQKEVVRLAMREWKGNLKQVTFQHVEAILDLTGKTSGRQAHLPGDLRVQREFEELCFLPKSPSHTFCCQLTIPGEVYVREVGKRVVARRIPVTESKEGTVLFDFDGHSLQIRNRRPGDRYCISPRSRRRKLKKLLCERRIPKSKRDRLVVFEAGSEIVWVEGFPSPAQALTCGNGVAVEIEVSSETSGQGNASK